MWLRLFSSYKLCLQLHPHNAVWKQQIGTDGPRVHTQTATMWNNVNETDKEEFTVIYETVEEEILSKTEVSEVVKPVKKVHRKRKAKTRQG